MVYRGTRATGVSSPHHLSRFAFNCSHGCAPRRGQSRKEEENDNKLRRIQRTFHAVNPAILRTAVYNPMTYMKVGDLTKVYPMSELLENLPMGALTGSSAETCEPSSTLTSAGATQAANTSGQTLSATRHQAHAHIPPAFYNEYPPATTPGSTTTRSLTEFG